MSDRIRTVVNPTIVLPDQIHNTFVDSGSFTAPGERVSVEDLCRALADLTDGMEEGEVRAATGIPAARIAEIFEIVRKLPPR